MKTMIPLLILLLTACGGGGGGTSSPSIQSQPSATPTTPASQDPVQDDSSQLQLTIDDYGNFEVISEGTNVVVADPIGFAADQHGGKVAKIFTDYSGIEPTKVTGCYHVWKVAAETIRCKDSLSGVAYAAANEYDMLVMSMHSAHSTALTDDFDENGVLKWAKEVAQFAAQQELVVVVSTENGTGECGFIYSGETELQDCGVLADAAFKADTGIQFFFVGTQDQVYFENIGKTYGDHVIFQPYEENATSYATPHAAGIIYRWMQENPNVAYKDTVSSFKAACVQDSVIICQ